MSQDYKIHREGGKKWRLPMRIRCNESFVMPKYTEYEVLGFRPPKKGEWYLSGATIGAWQAPDDLSDSYLVIRLTVRVKPVSVTKWVPVEETS